MPRAENTWIRLKCGYCGNIERTIPILDLFSADAEKQQIQCPECKTYLLNRREPFRALSDDIDTESLTRAQEAYANHDFEAACEAYSQLMAHPSHRRDPEVYWQYLMCYYGIVWIEDEAHRDVKPIIFHPRSGNKALIVGHPQYDKLMELARSESEDGTLNHYRSNAYRIRDIQLAFERLQTNYDVFLCCKKFIPGTQTYAPERKAAYSLKEYLESRGLRVFIDDDIPPAVNYEAYILAALRDSRLMLVFASCREYLHSPWVQNEWERFLWLTSQSNSSTTVRTGWRYIMPVACNDMQFEDFEQGICQLQGIKYTRNIDWSKSESIRVILNMIGPAKTQNPEPPAPPAPSAPRKNGSLLKVLSVLVVIALAAGGGWMASSRSRQTNAPERTVAAQVTETPAPTEIPTAAPTEAPAPGRPEVTLYADGAPVSGGVITVRNESLAFSWTASGELQRCDLQLLDSSGNIYTLPSQTESTGYTLSRYLLNTLKPGEVYTFQLTAVPAGENVTEKDCGKAQAQFTIPAVATATPAPAIKVPEVTLYADGAPVSGGVITVRNESLAFSWTASGEIQRCDLQLLDSSGNIYTLPTQTKSTGYTLSRDLLNTLQPGEVYTFQLTAVPAGENVTEKDCGKAQAQFIVPAVATATPAPAIKVPEVTLYADGAPVSGGVITVRNESLAFSWTASGEIQRCDLQLLDSSGNIYTLPSQTESTGYTLSRYLLNTLKPGETYTLELTAVPAGENVAENDYGRAQAQFIIPAAPAEIIGDSEIGTLGLSPAMDGEYPRLRTTALSGGAKTPVWSSTGNGSVITELEKDTVIKYLNHSILNKDGKIWMYVQCSQNQQGWISSENVEPIDEGGAELHVSQPDSESCCHLPLFSGEIYHPAVITGGSIPLRSGPGTEHDIYAFISKGDAPLWLGLSAFDEQDNVWYFVCCDDMQTGWVSSELCEITYDPQPLPSELLQ